MVNILYKILITYKDLDENIYKQPYEFFAENTDMAKKCALEVFSMEFGCFNIIDTEINPVEPSKSEKDKINTRLIQTIGVLCDKFNNLSYRDFILKFMQFSGYNLEIKDTENASFKFKFMSFTCEAKLIDGVSKIETEDIVYNSSTFKRTYIIRNNFVDIYVGTEV